MRAKRMWNRINSQILVWAGDDREQLKYDGVPILLPARDETAKTAKADPASPFRFEGARDGKDRLVPGTILVKDLVVETAEGGRSKPFDVSLFCEFLERDKPHLFERGLEIVSDVKDVEAAMKNARPLWEQSQVEKAQRILSAEMARISKYEDAGQPAPRASNADRVAWAIKHLHGREHETVAFGKEALSAALAGQYVDTPKAREAAPVVAPRTSMVIREEAAGVGLKLNKAELEALLDEDEEQIGFIEEKIKLRRQQATEKAAAAVETPATA